VVTKVRRTLSTVLLALIAAGLVTGSAPPAADKRSAAAPLIPEALVTAAKEPGGAAVEVELQIETPSQKAEARRAIALAGGEVLAEEQQSLRAKLPPAAALGLAQSTAVQSIAVNQKLALDENRIAVQDQPLAANQVASLASVSMEAMGVSQFRQERGVSGSGVTIAVIDSGIDPAHPDLQTTPDGRRKLVDWQDFSGEGYIRTEQEVAWDVPYKAPDGRTYRLPQRPTVSQGARFGFWDEFLVAGPYINRDLDQNGSPLDRFGVLLVDAQQTGRYDTVYVDSNNNADFTDEEPLKLFIQSQSVGRLGRIRTGPDAERRLGFVVASLDPQGMSVSLGFDGLGHGTQVAGVLGAHSENGFVGAAPGVQMLALKAVGSNGSGDWFAIKRAIRYALANGAQIINISLGGLAASASRFDPTASEWLNEVAREHGVLFILAADNSGPGLSSGATLGSPSEVMAVGAYYSPAMWMRDFGYVVSHESIWSLSGMGPRSDGSYVPSVVAPGGSPSTSPRWRHATGYTTAVGTSIAAPHAAGTAALLMEAGRRGGTQYDRLSVKRALELGARAIDGFKPFEQGNGLVTLPRAYDQLRLINSVPAVKARSIEGNGGLLARSYQPGSTAFYLSSLDKDPTRVGVYSSEAWVDPSLGTLLLPAGIERQLSLQLNPPQVPGLHSAFLMVTQQNKHGPSLTVPITYVRPLASGNSYEFAATDSLEVARYRRYFFAVKPGAAQFQLLTRVGRREDGQTKGRVQVHVFRPDGQAVHIADIGVKASGLTTVFTTPDPVEGVWEVVVTAIPDTDGSNPEAGYRLEVTASPGPLVGQPIRLNVAPGSVTTHPIQIKGLDRAFTGRVEVVGVTPLEGTTSWNAGIPWRVERKSQNLVEDFTLKEFAAQMRVEIHNPVPSGVDLDLYLYHLHPVDGWRLLAESVAKGTGPEVIELANLPSGRYQVLAVVRGEAPISLQYQYRRLMAIEGYHVKADDTIRKRARGEGWTVNLTLTAPKVPGRYLGQILLRDTEQNQIIGWYPFEVSVGQPALRVDPMVSQLVRGEAGSLVLELRNPTSGALVDASLTVNGRYHTSIRGQIAVPVTAAGSVFELDLQGDVPGYQFFSQRITVPVKPFRGLFPFGIEIGEELTAWRRKVMSQLP
jgi:subtilisin family serine protease